MARAQHHVVMQQALDFLGDRTVEELSDADYQNYRRLAEKANDLSDEWKARKSLSSKNGRALQSMADFEAGVSQPCP
jgi:hypothetical protein